MGFYGSSGSAAAQGVSVKPGTVVDYTHAIKRGDTLPRLRLALLNEDGTPANLSPVNGVEATVRFFAGTVGEGPAINETATVIDTVAAIVEWAPTQTNTRREARTYSGEFQVTRGSEVQTFPVRPGKLRVKIYEELG